MSLQILKDHNGKDIGVFIPIKDWKKLKKKYDFINELELESPKNILLEEMREAIAEIKLIEEGKKKVDQLESF